MVYKLPTRQARLPIVDSKGLPTSDFLRFLNIDLIGSIQTALNQNSDATAAIAQIVSDLQIVVAQLQATSTAAQSAQQAANNAQETADAAGGTATSGSASNPSIDLPTLNAWVNGPVVNLTGVVAGNLTITGSGPQQDGDVSVAGTGANGEFRIVEIDGMTETTRFTGQMNIRTFDGSTYTVTNLSSSEVQDFVEARTNTGAISYRIDARRTSGTAVSSLLLYIFARRTT